MVNDGKGPGVFPKQIRRKIEDDTTYIYLESRVFKIKLFHGILDNPIGNLILE